MAFSQPAGAGRPMPRTENSRAQGFSEGQLRTLTLEYCCRVFPYGRLSKTQGRIGSLRTSSNVAGAVPVIRHQARQGKEWYREVLL